jgi:hypothetical protein
MRYFITKRFNKFLKDEKLKRISLKEVITDIIAGNTVSLGKKLFKTRMKASGKGKSGGYRTLTYYKVKEKIIFIALLVKSERENFTKTELKALKLYAVELDKLRDKEIDSLVINNSFIELHFNVE